MCIHWSLILVNSVLVKTILTQRLSSVSLCSLLSCKCFTYIYFFYHFYGFVLRFRILDPTVTYFYPREKAKTLLCPSSQPTGLLWSIQNPICLLRVYSSLHKFMCARTHAWHAMYGVCTCVCLVRAHWGQRRKLSVLLPPLLFSSLPPSLLLHRIFHCIWLHPWTGS